MPTRTLRAALGVAGVIMLGVSFAVNSGPPADAAAADLLRFAAANHFSVVLGGWLQAIGSALLGVFAIALANGSSSHSPCGAALVVFGASALTSVSLLEVALYFTAVDASTTDLARLSLAMIRAVQHLYFIVAAPALFLPLGLEAAQSGALPRALAYAAILLGIGFFIVGAATISVAELPPRITALAAVQAAWWLAAAVVSCRGPQPRTVSSRAATAPSTV